MRQDLPPDSPRHSAIDLRDAFAKALDGGGWSPAMRGAYPVVAVLCDVSAWRRWSDDARALADPLERARADRLRDADDRDERVLVYALHRLLLGAWLDIPPAQVPIGRDAVGCPRLQGLHGHVSTSLSHPRGFAAFAISGQGSVGIDLEPAAHADAMEEIAGLAAHADEREALANLDGRVRRQALLSIWVRKEAYLKAEGVGLQRPPDSFAAPVGGPLPSRRVAAGLELRMLDAGAGHVAAIALPAGSDVRGLWLWPPASP